MDAEHYPSETETAPVDQEQPVDPSPEETETHDEPLVPAIEESAPEASDEHEQEPPSPEENSTEGEEGGVLSGTASEQAPGVGGTGDHPAPAAMINPEDGSLHVAGEPPNGSIAGSVAPAGESDLSDRDVSDPEALEKLNAVQEPEQVETERPDIGTE